MDVKDKKALLKCELRIITIILLYPVFCKESVFDIL